MDVPARPPTGDTDSSGDDPPIEPASTPRRAVRFWPPSPRAAIPLIGMAAVIGVLLVVFGGSSGSHRSPVASHPPATTTGPEVAVADVGDFPDGEALNVAIARLDPATLRPRTDASEAAPKTAQLSTATIERCAAVLPHASVDRGITRQRAVAVAAIAGRPVLLYSYDATATAKLPAGVRLFVVDEASCTIEYAQDH